MAQVDPKLSTGFPGLDRLLTGLMAGDNIVWQVEGIDEYRLFVDAYVQAARRGGRRIVYLRFAGHGPLLENAPDVETRVLRPDEGFENFLSGVHDTINRNRDAFYVFDLLSDLAVNWYSDQMLGNFFLLTCPYLYDVGAIAYFALIRGAHSPDAAGAISETAQVLINVFRLHGKLYVHPMKVQQRYSRTMYMLHVWEGETFVPVTQSATIAQIMTSVPWPVFEECARQGMWERTFTEAEDVLDGKARGADPAEVVKLFNRLLQMSISRDERMLALARKYLTMEKVLTIRRRMVGTGLIGGKALGMLLGRGILRAESPRIAALLEPHDSFFVGSDVFYTYIVRNGIWWIREKQKNPRTFLDGAEQARQRMLSGEFPRPVMRQFSDMLDYFGQSPVIVRSSSLLEDNYGNSFVGKYESVFCANQGPRHKRLEDFLAAVRAIYASSMSDEALTYRAQRGLLERDEQMALLVQRVSGEMYDELFYPNAAGVGMSYNPFVWNSAIEPEAGVLRIVFGLGTRAVNRSDDDYTRVVALNAPEMRVEDNFDKVMEYSQRRVDLIDLRSNRFASLSFPEVARNSPGLPMEIVASRNPALGADADGKDAAGPFPWVVTLNGLIRDTGFVATMKEILSTLHAAYSGAVETEFTVNLNADGGYRINLVQCRPLQVKGGGEIPVEPSVPEADRILEAHGAVIGQSRRETVGRIVYVAPSRYSELGIQKRYEVARLIGRITRHPTSDEAGGILLIGPGRWGTSTPSLGVPVNFSDIRKVSALCELVFMKEGIVPDVSLGTHFFHELVEQDILYMALFPARAENYLNAEYLEKSPSVLESIMPEEKGFFDIVRVVDVKRVGIYANALKQKVLCYLEKEKSKK